MKTKEPLQATNGATAYSFGKRRLQFDAAGRRTKMAFKSENRTGYLNLDTYQSYKYDSNKHRLTRIERDEGGETAAAAQASSIILALAFSAGIGISFGFYPARRAALLDPIDALSWE